MNILSISTLFPSKGYPIHGIFVFNRLKAMAKSHEITVINPLPDSPIHGILTKYKAFSLAPLQHKSNGMNIYHPRYLSIPGIIKKIEQHTLKRTIDVLVDKLLEQGKLFDCVDVHWTYPDLPVAIEIAERLKIPCNITLRGMEAFYSDEKDSRPAVIKDCLNKVDGVISLSNEMATYADELAKTLPITTVIRNGVDTDTFYYVNKKEARKQLGLNDKEIILLGVGSIILRKGFQYVISALIQLKKEQPQCNFHYYIVGKVDLAGNAINRLKKEIKKHHLQNNVHFMGGKANDELAQWYNAADVFILSSNNEGSPNVLTEALACGCPAVATNVGAVPDIMSSEEGLGIIVPIKSPHELAQAINTLLDSKNNRQAHSLSMQKYTWDWCAEKTSQALINMCQQYNKSGV